MGKVNLKILCIKLW